MNECKALKNVPCKQFTGKPRRISFLDHIVGRLIFSNLSDMRLIHLNTFAKQVSMKFWGLYGKILHSIDPSFEHCIGFTWTPHENTRLCCCCCITSTVFSLYFEGVKLVSFFLHLDTFAVSSVCPNTSSNTLPLYFCSRRRWALTELISCYDLGQNVRLKLSTSWQPFFKTQESYRKILFTIFFCGTTKLCVQLLSRFAAPLAV